MTSRRDFLRGALLATLPLGSAVTARAGTPALDRASPSLSIHKVIYETGSQAGVAFARRMARAGVAVRAIERDVTALWYRDLYYGWRDGASAVAGLTSHGALFCLEQLAWDHRLRVVFRGRHRQTAGGARHSLEGPASLLRAAASSALSEWPEAMADIVMRCPSRAGDPGALELVTPCAATTAAAEELYSWVIARPARARAS